MKFIFRKKWDNTTEPKIKIPVKVSTGIFVWTVNVFFLVDEELLAVTVHVDKEENFVRSTCGGARLEINIRRDEDFSSQNVTR